MAEQRQDDLVRDLVALGRAVDPPVSTDGLATAVMERVIAQPAPAEEAAGWRTRLRLGSRRRRIALVVGAVLLALLATPPVRATVAEWFGFGGVVVEPGAPQQSPASPPPTVPSDQSLTDAAEAVDFTVWVPVELGAPDGVEVSGDGRFVSMSWSTAEAGVVRLDQFDARLDWAVIKHAPDVEYVAVDATDALWFDEPHEVALLEPDGTRSAEPARLAGQTLIWQEGATTLRLEGDLTVDRAVEVAESALPVS